MFLFLLLVNNYYKVKRQLSSRGWGCEGEGDVKREGEDGGKHEGEGEFLVSESYI